MTNLSVSDILEAMSRHAIEAAPQVLPLPDQLATAQDMLVAHPLTEEFSERVAQDTLGADEETAYNAVADGIFDALGVPGEEAVESWESGYRNLGTSTAILRLRRAADTAAAAAEFGFDRDAPEDDLRGATSSVLEDLSALRGRAIQDSAFKESPEYSDRRRALTLLAESGIRELGRRNNVGDDLTPRNLQAVQDATGLHLVESGPHDMVFRAVITSHPSRRGEAGQHHQEHEKPVVRPRQPEKPGEMHDWYYIPAIAGPNVPRHPALGSGWVPGRLGHFALDPRYTGGRLPR